MIIYKATNTITGKCYIGRTIHTLKKRRTEHLSEAKRGTHRPFYNAIRKYGKTPFVWEVLAECNSYDDMVSAETRLMKEHNSLVPNGYNLVEFQTPMSNLSRRNMSTNNGRYWLGKTRPKETRDKISKSHVGKSLSDEHKCKIALSNKGKCRSMETKEKIRHALVGHLVLDTTRKKISIANTTRKYNGTFEHPLYKSISDDTRNRVVDLYKTGHTPFEIHKIVSMSRRKVSEIIHGKK